MISDSDIFQSLSLSMFFSFALIKKKNSSKGTIGIELNQPTGGVSHFRNIVDLAVDAWFEGK